VAAGKLRQPGRGLRVDVRPAASHLGDRIGHPIIHPREHSAELFSQTREALLELLAKGTLQAVLRLGDSPLDLANGLGKLILERRSVLSQLGPHRFIRCRACGELRKAHREALFDSTDGSLDPRPDLAEAGHEVLFGDAAVLYASDQGPDGRLDGPDRPLTQLSASALQLFDRGADLRVQICQSRRHRLAGELAGLVVPAHIGQPRTEACLELPDRIAEMSAQIGELLLELLPAAVCLPPGRLHLVQRRREPLLDAVREGHDPRLERKHLLVEL
jgi:hypothetical protein